MPLHVTCLMQMVVIRRKLNAGMTKPGTTVAWRRYQRMERVHMRRLQANVTALLGPPRFQYPDSPNDARDRAERLPAEVQEKR